MYVKHSCIKVVHPVSKNTNCRQINPCIITRSLFPLPSLRVTYATHVRHSRVKVIHSTSRKHCRVLKINMLTLDFNTNKKEKETAITWLIILYQECYCYNSNNSDDDRVLFYFIRVLTLIYLWFNLQAITSREPSTSLRSLSLIPFHLLPLPQVIKFHHLVQRREEEGVLSTSTAPLPLSHQLYPLCCSW